MKLSLRPLITATILVPAFALASPPIPADALGRWAPNAAVDTKGLTLIWKWKTARYDHTDVNQTCFAGASRESTTYCVSTVVAGSYPFTVVFNLDGAEDVVRFDVGNGTDLPPTGRIWRRCR